VESWRKAWNGTAQVEAFKDTEWVEKRREFLAGRSDPSTVSDEVSPAYGRFAKYHLHRERVGELCQRPEKVEEGRDASDRVAEDPYRFFSRAPWRVAKRERVREEGSCNGEVKGGRF